MQVDKLVQNGNMMQANFSVESSNHHTYKSQLFTINNVVTFQIQVICTGSTNVIGHNFNVHHINMNFSKLSQDGCKYILSFSSKELKIYNKCFNNDDGSWYFIDTLRPTQSSFDVTVILETVDSKYAFESLYHDDVLTDFELRCEDDSINVHKAVLAASSPVLRRELEGNWRETKEGCVTVPDVSKTTLRHFKQYLYLHVLPDTGVEELLLLASYYMMPELEDMCVRKLQAGTNAKNAHSMLEFAFLHRMTKLQLAVLRCIELGSVKVTEIEKEIGGKTGKYTQNEN